MQTFPASPKDKGPPNSDIGERAPPSGLGKAKVSELPNIKTSQGPIKGISVNSNGAQTPKRKRELTPPNSPNEQGNPCTSPSEKSPPSKLGRASTKNMAHLSPKRAFKPYKADGPKSKWTLPPIHHKTLLLGDSNLARITKTRSNLMHICSYPGARFSNLFGLLKTVTPYTCVKDLVLSVGINDRGNDSKTTNMPMLKKVISEAKRAFPNAKIHLASLQWNPSRIKSKEVEKLEELNLAMESLSEINLLPALSSDLFKIQHTDPYGIHWTTETANALVDNWVSNLN